MTQGYWFAADTVLPHGDGRPVVVGEKLTIDPPLEMCARGLHAARHPSDALKYAPGSLLYRVELSGELIEDHDKLCASERTALAMIDATELLRAFARRQALSVIHLWTAPEIVKQFLETGDENIRAAARDAARDAAWAAAWYAAWAAAGAAARDAAGDAARQMFLDMVLRAFGKETEE